MLTAAKSFAHSGQNQPHYFGEIFQAKACFGKYLKEKQLVRTLLTPPHPLQIFFQISNIIGWALLMQMG